MKLKYLIVPNNVDEHEHSIVIPSGNGDELNIPLSLHGVTSYFPTRKPTLDEYNKADHDDTIIDVTYDSPEWDPHSETFNNQEIEACRAVGAKALSPNRFFCSMQTQHQVDASTILRRQTQSSCVLSEMSPCLNDDTFIELMKDNVYTPSIVQVSTSAKKPGITAATLIKN